MIDLYIVFTGLFPEYRLVGAVETKNAKESPMMTEMQYRAGGG